MFKDINNKTIKRGQTVIDLAELEITKVLHVWDYAIDLDTELDLIDNEKYVNNALMVINKTKAKVFQPLLDNIRKTREWRHSIGDQ